MNPALCLANAFALPPRWLVVDDEPGLSEIIAETLANLGLASVEKFTSARRRAPPVHLLPRRLRPDLHRPRHARARRPGILHAACKRRLRE